MEFQLSEDVVEALNRIPHNGPWEYIPVVVQADANTPVSAILSQEIAPRMTALSAQGWDVIPCVQAIPFRAQAKIAVQVGRQAVQPQAAVIYWVFWVRHPAGEPRPGMTAPLPVDRAGPPQITEEDASLAAAQAAYRGV